MYSVQETGYLALQCPEHAHYHVQGEGVLLEVLDAAGRTCAPGEVGRVVVTPLHNFAMPLIRYDIGDYAEVGERCACGRGLPVLNRILGRVRNMVTLPSGERYWPPVYGERYREVAPIRQFQIVQKSLERLEVKLVADRELTAAEQGKLRDLIHQRIRYPFELTFTYHDEIPRGPGGKYEDFKSELAAPSEDGAA
jgi:phenylacetate-CoA ligase